MKRFCNCRFDNKRFLLKHKRIEHPPDRGPKDCTICGKMLKRDTIPSHMRLHTTEGREKYKCHQCGKGFPRNRALNVS